MPRFAWILCLLVSLPAVTQQDVDVDHSVKLHGDTLEIKSGWTWCVDPGCSMLATNYHIAKEGLPDNIGGAKVLEVYLATGPTIVAQFG